MHTRSMSTSRTHRIPRGSMQSLWETEPINAGSAPSQIHLMPAAVSPGSRVRLVSVDDNAMAQFFGSEPGNSLLVCGDSEKALASVPDGGVSDLRNVATILVIEGLQHPWADRPLSYP